jgi:hypothetical protein
MNFHFACFGGVAAVLCFAPSIGAQTSAPSSEEQRNATYAAHQADFDYLLGDWEFTAESKQYGNFTGRWSAARLETGQILDEYRVLGGKGETIHVTSTVRSYNSAAGRWELIGMDRGGGLLDFGTGQRVGDEMHLEQKFDVAGGRPVTLRIRYYNIRSDRFSWSADRSTDDGKTWTADFQRIEARRIGPSRSLGALTPAPRTRN